MPISNILKLTAGTALNASIKILSPSGTPSNTILSANDNDSSAKASDAIAFRQSKESPSLPSTALSYANVLRFPTIGKSQLDLPNNVKLLTSDQIVKNFHILNRDATKNLNAIQGVVSRGFDVVNKQVALVTKQTNLIGSRLEGLEGTTRELSLSINEIQRDIRALQTIPGKKNVANDNTIDKLDSAVGGKAKLPSWLSTAAEGGGILTAEEVLRRKLKPKAVKTIKIPSTSLSETDILKGDKSNPVEDILKKGAKTAETDIAKKVGPSVLSKGLAEAGRGGTPFIAYDIMKGIKSDSQHGNVVRNQISDFLISLGIDKKYFYDHDEDSDFVKRAKEKNNPIADIKSELKQPDGYKTELSDKEINILSKLDINITSKKAVTILSEQDVTITGKNIILDGNVRMKSGGQLQSNQAQSTQPLTAQSRINNAFEDLTRVSGSYGQTGLGGTSPTFRRGIGGSPDGNIPEAGTNKAGVGKNTGQILSDALAGKLPVTSQVVDDALKEEGLSENKDREALKAYLKSGGKSAVDPATTAWCASFVNATLQREGIKGTDSAAAGSFQSWGNAVNDPTHIQKADVLVNRTYSPQTGMLGSHVVMATGQVKRDKNGNVTHIETIGGNEPDSVRRGWKSIDEVRRGWNVRRTSIEGLPEDVQKQITGGQLPEAGQPQSPAGSIAKPPSYTINKDATIKAIKDNYPMAGMASNDTVWAGFTDKLKESGVTIDGNQLKGDAKAIQTTIEGFKKQFPNVNVDSIMSAQQGSNSKSDVYSIIEEAAKAHGLDPNAMKAYASIESNFNPDSNRNKSTQYKGLFQLGADEFNQYGNGGDIYDPRDNAFAAAAYMADNKKKFTKQFGREPNDTEIYMMHQQGFGFYKNGTMTNIAGNPYPGMRGPQTHDSFEQGWGDTIAQRKVKYGGNSPIEQQIDSQQSIIPQLAASTSDVMRLKPSEKKIADQVVEKKDSFADRFVGETPQKDQSVAEKVEGYASSAYNKVKGWFSSDDSKKSEPDATKIDTTTESSQALKEAGSAEDNPVPVIKSDRNPDTGWKDLTPAPDTTSGKIPTNADQPTVGKEVDKPVPYAKREGSSLGVERPDRLSAHSSGFESSGPKDGSSGYGSGNNDSDRTGICSV